MERREFLFDLCLGAAAGQAMAGQGATEPTSQAAQMIYPILVAANDEQIPKWLERQEQVRSHRWFGGGRDEFGIHSAGVTAGLVKVLTAAFCCPESLHYRSRDLLAPLEAASAYLLRAQHEDGTIDLHTTNFHSPPDTAFVLEPVCASAAVIRKSPAGLERISENLERFIRVGGGALARGGIHTPNHRWVVCSALARVNSLFPDPRYPARIEDWLGEGIDIDPDGQYSERSSAVYSPTCDRMLLTAGLLLDRKSLLDPVRRNLEMTLFYLQPNGDVVTEASRRQDQFTRGSLAGYHLPYRYMALTEGNRRFASAARLIEKLHGRNLYGNLIHFLEDPTLKGMMPEGEPLPENYEKLFRHSQVARIRRGQSSATILAQNSTFFSFHRPDCALESVRFASAFFGKGQFKGEELRHEGDAYIMSQRLSGPYYQPLPPAARTHFGIWNREETGSRPQSEVQHLRQAVRIVEEKGGFGLEISIEGTDNVPVAVELGFRKGGTLSGATPVTGAVEAFLLEDGAIGVYAAGGHRISFGPGTVGHTWVQLRGAEPKLNALSVYLTGFTPFKHRLQIQ